MLDEQFKFGIVFNAVVFAKNSNYIYSYSRRFQKLNEKSMVENRWFFLQQLITFKLVIIRATNLSSCERQDRTDIADPWLWSDHEDSTLITHGSWFMTHESWDFQYKNVIQIAILFQKILFKILPEEPFKRYFFYFFSGFSPMIFLISLYHFLVRTRSYNVKITR